MKKVQFKVQKYAGDSPNVFYLEPSNWDDYTFRTSFDAFFVDTKKCKISLGLIKIGYQGQQGNSQTSEKIGENFTELPEGFFSLGQDVSYYQKIHDCISDTTTRDAILEALKDLVSNNELLERVQSEHVLNSSLLREVSFSLIQGQFRRVLNGEAERTDYKFRYSLQENETTAAINLEFTVKAESKPPTNVHILIGRNGVGKTTIINGMISSALSLDDQYTHGNFQIPGYIKEWEQLPSNYFSRVVSVSFSVFDPFTPPVDQNKNEGTIAYNYIGMKVRSDSPILPDQQPLKNKEELTADFIESFVSCFNTDVKKNRWITAIEYLESDSNFAAMELTSLNELTKESAKDRAEFLFKKMSSGHSIVLLTITKLVDFVDEKTLVLIDEPESYLHPPLLSAFTRALSELLQNRNGIAIIATHSPVVLQEVPKSCVWKLARISKQGRSDRPERETFGENLGILTREVFGLEVTKSGFHEILQNEVNAGKSFEEIMSDYNNQLGYEAQALLEALIYNKNNKNEKA